MSYYADYSNYTNFHDVDEEMRAITAQSGMWVNGSKVGVMDRNIGSAPASAWDTVASLCRTIQKKINITHPH